MAWHGFWTVWLRLAALMALALAGVSGPARAHDGIDDGGPVRLNLQPCIKAAVAGDRAAALLRDAAAFDCTTGQTEFGPGDYWVRLDVPGPASPAARNLRWTSLWQAGATVHVAYDDGIITRYAVPAANSGRYVHIGGYFTLPLRRDSVARTILFEVRDSGNMRGILLGPTLASSDVIAGIDTRRAALYGGFVGLCLALLAYNIMMWRAIRERYLLAYCAMVVAALAYAFTSSATLAQLVPAIDNNLRLRINYVLLAATAMAALWFVRLFFDTVAFSRRFDRALVGGMALVGATSLGFALLAPWQIGMLDTVYTLSFAAVFALGLVMFVKGWRTGGQAERLFVVAWLLPVAFNLLRMLHSLGLIAHNFWIDNATLVAMSAEALLASMVMAHRIRFMRADRDAARADEKEARLLADTDELTGLANRRALMRSACPAPAEAGQYRLILIDIDHFKAINDSAGHSAGDAVLQKVAGVIRAAMRPEVIAARIGGEEFALLFPTGNVDRRYYSSLLARIRALPPVGGQRVTISMGAANGWLGGSEGEWLALYRAADAALYEAKRTGRNRLVVAPRYRDLPEVA